MPESDSIDRGIYGERIAAILGVRSTDALLFPYGAISVRFAIERDFSSYTSPKNTFSVWRSASGDSCN